MDQVWNAPSGKVTLGMKINNNTIRMYFSKRDTDMIVH
jgi:hypothetical protein